MIRRWLDVAGLAGVVGFLSLVGCGGPEPVRPSAAPTAPGAPAPMAPAAVPGGAAAGTASRVNASLALVEPAPGPGPEGHQYREGCQARVFLLREEHWATAALPPAPAMVLTLTGFPARVEARRSNALIATGIGGMPGGLDYYAVEFVGAYYAAEDGLHTFLVRSDDPYELLIEDTTVLRSAFWFDVRDAMKRSFNRQIYLSQSAQVKRTNTTQGSIELVGGRYYHLTLRCRQQRVEPDPRSTPTEDAGAAMGADLFVTACAPSGTSGPLRTYLRRHAPPATERP